MEAREKIKRKQTKNLMENKVIFTSAKSRATNAAHTNNKEDVGVEKYYIWFFISALFFFFSLALSAGVYFIVTRPVEFFEDPLKALSVKLGLSVEQSVESNLVPRRIDGVMVKPGKENFYPLAIMIDNHFEARPPSGLSKANLVIEAAVEGGISRYLAFYASGEMLDKIGPIRSARPYYVDWAREFSALYAHVGGSPEALVKIKKENVLHINEFYNGSYFWRGQQQAPPHNVYTSSEKLDKYLENKGLTEGKYFSWQFKDDENIKSRPATSTIAISHPSAYYRVRWQYDQNSNNYERFLAGEPHRDVDSKTIKAKNVIIQRIARREIDELLRIELDHIGTGTAMVCMDGKCADGIWQKKSATARTRFYDNDNNEFLYNSGITWIQVVSPGAEVTY